MPRIALAEGASVHCIVDDFLWPWVDSTPVLMMHGFARNATFWNRWVPATAETHRVYRPDLLGCGLSDQPPKGYRYTPETIGTQVLAVLDGLCLSKMHWVGESSGGIIGLLLAAVHPDRIASLVLCNTPTRIRDHIKRRYALGHASASEAMRASGVGVWCRQTLGNRLDLAHASEALCDWVVREMDRTPPGVAAAMHDCFESVDFSTLLPSISAPVLLLSGDNSRSPRHNRRRLPRPCRTAWSSCLPVTATASICCNRSAARALLWNSGDLTFSGRRRNTTVAGDSAAAVGAILHWCKFERGRVHCRDRPGCRPPAARRRSAASRSARLDRGHCSTGVQPGSTPLGNAIEACPRSPRGELRGQQSALSYYVRIESTGYIGFGKVNAGRMELSTWF